MDVELGDALKDGGFDAIEKVAQAEVEALAQVASLGPDGAEQLIAKAKRWLDPPEEQEAPEEELQPESSSIESSSDDESQSAPEAEGEASLEEALSSEEEELKTPKEKVQGEGVES